MIATRTATSTNDVVSEDAEATNPITPGAARPLAYAMPATPAMLRAGLGPTRPAAEKTSGTTTATPIPSSAKAARANAGLGARITATAPTAAHAPESRTVRTGPSLLITRSPTSLTEAMATANADTAKAAVVADPPSSSRM